MGKEFISLMAYKENLYCLLLVLSSFLYLNSTSCLLWRTSKLNSIGMKTTCLWQRYLTENLLKYWIKMNKYYLLILHFVITQKYHTKIVTQKWDHCYQWKKKLNICYILRSHTRKKNLSKLRFPFADAVYQLETTSDLP